MNFIEVNTDGFDFIDGFKFSDVHKFEKLKNLSFDIFELNFCHNKNKWKHILIPIKVSNNVSDKNHRSHDIPKSLCSY